MRKIICLCLIIILLSGITVFADTPLKKLGRGLANIISCPMEIPYRTGEANVANGPFAAATWGILEGIYRTLVRASVGVYEVVTFPLPWWPSNYGPIIDDPEFFLEEGVF